MAKYTWQTKRAEELKKEIIKGEKNSKCFIFLNGKSLQISKSQFNYLENKKSRL